MHQLCLLKQLPEQLSSYLDFPFPNRFLRNG